MKVSIYETYENGAVIVAPGMKEHFESWDEAVAYAKDHGMEVNISHRFGSVIKKENGGSK